MGPFFAILWIVGFSLIGIFCLVRRQKTDHYQTFRAKVAAVHRSRGKRHTAVLQPEISQVRQFEIEFQDIGDYYENDVVHCMWDGKNEATVQEDLRENLRLGILFSFGAVALMFVVFLFTFLI